MRETLQSARNDLTDETKPPRRQRPVETTRWPWYRSPWVIAAAVIVVFNLLYALPRYLSLDPTLSRVGIDPDFPLHHEIIVVHVVTGNIAMVAMFLQILPWLRQRSVRFHRWSGLVYLYGGALPSALLALALLPPSLAPTGKVGLAAMSIAWIATSVAGYRTQARHHYRDHRRWMTYSFAIALGTSWGRTLNLGMQTFPWFKMDIMIFLELVSWLWVVNVLIAHWWLQRRTRLNRARASLRPKSNISVSE